MGRHTKRAYQVGDWFLSQRGATWYRCRYDAKRRQTERVSLGSECLEQAKSRLDAWWAEQYRLAADELPPSQVKLAAVITDYWNGQAQHLRSADTCKIMLRYWNDWWGEASVADVRNPSRQDDFRAHLAAKGLNPTSVTRCLEVGRAAIRRAWKRGAISSFPHIDVPLIGETEPKGRPLTVEEVGKLIAGTTEPHLQLFVLLLAATAARPEALFQLTWAQIDDEAGLIRLNPEGRRQTSKRRPVVQLLPSLVPVLAGVKRSDKHPNVILFRSKPIRKVDTGWHKMVERSKLKGRVTPYSLRHTAARWMRMKGVPMEQVAGQLGHAMPRFAMSERYAPHAPDYLKEAAAALDELLTLVLPAASQLRISESGKSSSISALAV